MDQHVGDQVAQGDVAAFGPLVQDGATIENTRDGSVP